MKPKISVIVPVYNVEKYLDKCIKSILNQTYTNLEIILVNDGSTDNCGGICDYYAEIDKRIKVIHQKNCGLSNARNTGLSVAQGEYIGFVDSDDWIEPIMYETLLNLSERYRADVSTCLIRKWTSGRQNWPAQSTEEVNVLESKSAIEYMYTGRLTGFSACNKLYTRNIFHIINFPENRIYEDAAIMYKVYYRANKVVYINQCLYNYISRSNSITKMRFSNKRFDAVLNYQETYSYMEKNLPEVCEILNNDYLKTLRNMVVDIVNENKLYKNYKYLLIISKFARNEIEKFLNNRLISINHKILSLLIASAPLITVYLYKMRMKLKSVDLKSIKN